MISKRNRIPSIKAEALVDLALGGLHLSGMPTYKGSLPVKHRRNEVLEVRDADMSQLLGADRDNVTEVGGAGFPETEGLPHVRWTR